MIKVVKDKDPIWDTDDFDVILLGTSAYNRMGGGFASKLRFKYPVIEERDRNTKYGDTSKIGTRLTIDGKPTISLMYMCGYPRKNRENVYYDALRQCLTTANAEFRGKKVLMTIVGSSQFDGNGDREKCLGLIRECLTDLYVTVYDYKQKRRREEIDEQRKYLKSLRYTDKEKYERLRGVFDTYLKKLYLNGERKTKRLEIFAKGK